MRACADACSVEVFPLDVLSIALASSGLFEGLESRICRRPSVQFAGGLGQKDYAGGYVSVRGLRSGPWDRRRRFGANGPVLVDFVGDGVRQGRALQVEVHDQFLRAAILRHERR